VGREDSPARWHSAERNAVPANESSAAIAGDFHSNAYVGQTYHETGVYFAGHGFPHTIYSQRNFNSGGRVSEESMQDARPGVVKLFHDVCSGSVYQRHRGERVRVGRFAFYIDRTTR
jgi:hypothetical protein